MCLIPRISLFNTRNFNKFFYLKTNQTFSIKIAIKTTTTNNQYILDKNVLRISN